MGLFRWSLQWVCPAGFAALDRPRQSRFSVAGRRVGMGSVNGGYGSRLLLLIVTAQARPVKGTLRRLGGRIFFVLGLRGSGIEQNR